MDHEYDGGSLDNTALIWSLQFEHPYLFDLDMISLYLVNKYFCFLLENHPILISKWKIEPVTTLNQAVKNYSRRYPTKYSLMYRNPEWVLKKAIKVDNYDLARSVVTNKGISIERQQYFATWVGLNNYVYDLGDFHLESYELGVDLRNGKKCHLPRSEFIVLLARYRGSSAVKEILAENGNLTDKYEEAIIKTGDLKHIQTNLVGGKLKYQKTAWRLGRQDIAAAVLCNQNYSEEWIVEYFKYMQLLYGGQIDLIKEINFSTFDGRKVTQDGSLLLCALYSMKIEGIKSVFSLGKVNSRELETNPSVRGLGKSPGETTPKKLLEVKKLLTENEIDVVKINKIFLHFVIRNDDLESVPVLINDYGITAEDVGDYVHLGATTIGKIYPKIEPPSNLMIFGLEPYTGCTITPDTI